MEGEPLPQLLCLARGKERTHRDWKHEEGEADGVYRWSFMCPASTTSESYDQEGRQSFLDRSCLCSCLARVSQWLGVCCEHAARAGRLYRAVVEGYEGRLPLRCRGASGGKGGSHVRKVDPVEERAHVVLAFAVLRLAGVPDDYMTACMMAVMHVRYDGGTRAVGAHYPHPTKPWLGSVMVSIFCWLCFCLSSWILSSFLFSPYAISYAVSCRSRCLLPLTTAPSPTVK